MPNPVVRKQAQPIPTSRQAAPPLSPRFTSPKGTSCNSVKRASPSQNNLRVCASLHTRTAPGYGQSDTVTLAPTFTPASPSTKSKQRTCCLPIGGKAVEVVNEWVHVPLTQSQFDALCDFT